MPSMNRLLTRSLAATISPETAASRRQELEAIPNPIARATALRINRLVASHPGKVAALLGIDYEPRSLEVIGKGWHSVVIRNSASEVLKVNQASLLYTPTERVAFIERKRDEHEAMAAHLGSFVLPQDIFVGKHPVFRNREVVEITQPFKTIVDPGLFYRGCTESSVASSVHDLRASHPGTAAQLAAYVELSYTLYDRTKLLPDSLGAGNLVLDTSSGNLLMIDGQPIGENELDIQQGILENLSYLDRALTA